MKNITDNMMAHIQQELTSLATVWLVQRRDGSWYAFTDFDLDLRYSPSTPGDIVSPSPYVGGFPFLAGSGMTRNNLSDKAQMDVSNIQADGIIDGDMITDHDIRARLWDYAFAIIAQVNWGDLAFQAGPSCGDIRLFTGQFGPLTLNEYKWSVEMKGLSDQLNRVTGDLYQPTCRVDLGSPDCGVNLFSVPENLDRSAWSIYAVESEIEPTYPASNMIDGNPATLWSSSNGAVSWVEFDLGVAQSIISFSIQNRDDDTTGPNGTGQALGGPLQMQFFVSNDHSTWTQVGTSYWGNGVPGGIDVFPLPATQNALYVKLSILSVWGSNTNVVIAEFFLSTTVSLMQNGSVASTDGWRNMNVLGVSGDSGIFDGGLVTWLTGANAYSSIEIRQWFGQGPNQAGGNVNLFLKTTFQIQPGDTFTIQPGCDKLFSTCKLKFNNAVNFRGENAVPSPDRLLEYPDYQAPHS